MTDAMTASERFKFEAMRDNLTRTLTILEGMCPAGSLPEPCCRTREAGRRQGDPLEYASELALPDQGKGALVECLEEFTRQAAYHEAMRVSDQAHRHKVTKGEAHKRIAATWKDAASMLEKALRAPRPQSEVDAGERCKVCGDKNEWIGGFGFAKRKCVNPSCTESRKERSVSGNEQGD